MVCRSNEKGGPEYVVAHEETMTICREAFTHRI